MNITGKIDNKSPEAYNGIIESSASDINDRSLISGAFNKTRIAWKWAFANNFCEWYMIDNIDFDASESNKIYGNSDTVQPPSMEVKFFIKYI